MKTDLYTGKHISLHFTIMCYGWEFHVLPFFDVMQDRILCGWLCFTAQLSYEANESE